jgi:hypothetical protein
MRTQSGAIIIQSGTYGSGKNRKKVSLYACSYRYKRGNTVCPNTLMQRVDLVDEQLLTMLEETILTTDAFAYIYRMALEDIKKSLKDKLKEDGYDFNVLKKERDKVQRELRNFEQVIASGNSNEQVIVWMNKRVERLKQIETKIIEMEAAPKLLQLNLDKVEGEIPSIVKDKIQDFRGLLRRNVESAREALKELLEGRIIFTPIDHQEKLTYRIQATLKTGKVLDNLKFSNIGVPTGVRCLCPHCNCPAFRGKSGMID